MFKIWSKQLLIRPDETPYLMASGTVRLAANADQVFVYTNTPQVLADTLSGQEG